MSFMSVQSTTTTKLTTKEQINIFNLISTIIPVALYFFVVLPGWCTALNPADGVPFWSIRNNGRRNNGFRQRQRSIEPVKSTRTRPILSASINSSDTSHHNDKVLQPELLFQTRRPLLAVITETDACDTEEKMQYTYETVKKATSTGKVDLVSIRLSLPASRDDNGDENESYYQVLDRARRLTKDLVALSSKQREERRNDDDEQPQLSFVVVCSSDLVSVAVDARANGVHVKEHHLGRLPHIVGQFDYPIVIGTSTHSVESALKSYFDSDENNPSESKIKPHYYFVGTCYLTASHPEKTLESQLEGPELPGRVKMALKERAESKNQSTILPRIMAIGGIDETNCHKPVALGADGVAVIRAVLQADLPVERVEDMQTSMMRTYADQQ